MNHGPHCDLDGGCEECECKGCGASHSAPMCPYCQVWQQVG
jgi:hypothetical protein